MNEDLMVIEPEDVRPVQALTLFGTADPIAVLDKAGQVASALAKVIDKQKLYAVIGGKKYVTVEGWTLLGSMLGVFPRVEWTRKVENGWEARAVAVVAGNGTVVGAGEAQCCRDESGWAKRDDYALRAMAQTRAVSRALRGPLDFVVRIAGYVATPAEEMPQDLSGTRAEPPVHTSTASPGAPPPVPHEILERFRREKLAKTDSVDPLPEELCCPVCGHSDFLRPRHKPQFCEAKAGGCGAPKRGDGFTLITRAEWESYRRV